MAVGAVGVISVAAHWVGPQLAPGRRRLRWPATWPRPSPATPSCSTPSTSSPPRSSPTRCPAKADAACPGPAGRASAACPWGASTPELDAQAAEDPGRRRATCGHGRPACLSAAKQAEAQAGPGRLPGRTRGDRPQLRLHRGRGAHRRPRLRDHVPRPRHAGHRPGPARVHLPARPQGPGRRDRPHPRPRGPHRRPGLPAARGPGADLRLRADRRPGPPPHRRGRPGGQHQVHPGGGRRDA